MTDVPTVRLAGRDWPMPMLAIKQNRIVLPTFFRFMPTFMRVAEEAKSAAKSDPLWFANIALTTEDFDNMCLALYTALTRGTPGLARNEFDNLEISVEDLFLALPMVARATGILKPAAEAPVAQGEGEATVETSISTSSSPTTASALESPGQTTSSPA